MSKESWVKACPQLNNKGVTLVEVVVALLIMGIITVPLLNIFTGTARLNALNTRKANADTVASNVMEAIKVYGLEGTAREAFKAKSASGESTTFLGYTIKKSNLTGDTDVIVRNPSDGKLSFTKKATNTYEFVMDGIREGGINSSNDEGNEYKVSIEMSSVYADDASGKNANEMNGVDLSAFNSESTVFINPIGTGVYYDEEALSYFKELNENHRDSEWDSECARIGSLNDAAIENAEANGQPDPVLSPTPAPYPYDSEDVLLANMARNIKITVSREKDDSVEHGEEYYLINSSIIYTIDPEYVGLGNNEITKGGYCSNVKFENLDSIYLIYVPFGYMTSTGLSSLNTQDTITFGEAISYVGTDGYAVNLPKESITFINNTSGAPQSGETEHFNLYVAIQADMDAHFNGSLTCDYLGDASEATAFSQASLAGTIPYDNTKGLVHVYESPKHVDRIVTVNITVESKDGSITRTLSSSIQEK